MGAQAHPTQTLLDPHMLEVRGLKSYGSQGNGKFYKSMRKGLPYVPPKSEGGMG